MAVNAIELNSSRVMMPSPLRSIALNKAFVIDAVAIVPVEGSTTFNAIYAALTPEG